MGMRWNRHSAAVTRTKLWKHLRLEILRRDNYRCRSCGAGHSLEVDHVEPVRDRPDLAYERANLQTLCTACHSRKTRVEIGLGNPDPQRELWKRLVRDMGRNLRAMEKDNA